MNKDILDILERASKKGIKLELEGDALTLKSKSNTVDQGLLQEIKEAKEAIVRYLKIYKNSTKNKAFETSIVTIDRGSEHKFPLSFGQERLWFLDQFQKGSTEYHAPLVFKLEGKLNITVLERSLQEIVTRHEVLRTVIRSDEGIAYQEVLSEKNWELSQAKIKESENLREVLMRFLDKPFNLSNDYMLRACIYELRPNEYILITVFHHICNDGWSDDVFIRELTELYRSFLENKESRLEPLPLQYIDYSVWQRNHIEGEVLENQLKYWKKQLQDVAPLVLPIDYKRPSTRSTRGGNYKFSIDDALELDLKSICKEEEVTLFMLLLTVYKVLLYRYSNQDDICVGIPIANRTQEETEGMIGFFVNTLALRSELSNSTTFDVLLQSVKDTTLSGYDNQHAPFEKVVDQISVSRDTSISPVFQVMFSLQNTTKDTKVELNELTLSPFNEFERELSNFDITLVVEEAIEGGILVNIEYCSDLFRRATIARMAVHYQELLRSIVANRKQKVSTLSMISATERLELLETFNDTKQEYDREVSILDLFKNQVDKTPDGIALVFGDEKMTYTDLDTKSNQLANYLKSEGAIAGNHIGLLFHRGFDMIISMLGVLKSGCTYVPLDPSLPLNRLRYILEDADISQIIYNDPELLEATGISGFTYIDTTLLSDYEEVIEIAKRSIDTTAYIMYTSGTTGTPKGILITDENVITLLSDKDAIHIKSTDKVLQWSNYGFDGSTWEIFGSLLGGATLYLIEGSVASDAIALSEVIEKEQLSVVFITTALFNAFVDHDVSSLSSLRILLFGGELVSVPHARKALEILGVGRIIHVYGPTETTTYVLHYEINEIPDTANTVPIGKPLSNTGIYILNSDLEVVPVGVVGELCVAGSGLARGYLNREDLTTEKFVANPFVEGERMYRTGDLARWLPSGDIEFIGRKDDQVKIRGYRIELGEIEQVLSELSYIHSCCVVALSEGSGSKRLVGYVVVGEGYDRSVMQQDLSNLLPDYMVPGVWVELDVMPLTRNGKIDKKGLPSPDMSSVSSQEYVGPRNAIEEQLAAIWQELLGLERVGVYDNFFELGGHSLLATRLVSQIRKELDVELAIKDVFVHSVLSSLASHIGKSSSDRLLPSITVQDRGDRIPLSFSQERLWFLDQLDGGSIQYHIPFALRLEGDVSIDVLKKSFKKIVDRHEVLRTVINSEDGVGYQEVQDSEGWDLEVVSIEEGSLPSDLEVFVNKVFDLSRDYMLRVRLYDLGDKQYVLSGVFHHISSDGWSNGIIIREFLSLYSSFSRGEELELEALPLQYIDYALWQREYLEGAVLEGQLSYWASHLSGVGSLSLPTDYGRPQLQSSAGATIDFEAPKGLLGSLEAISQQEGVTLFMVLLSAFKVLLSRYSGQEDICVGTSIANRTQEESEGMIGFFVNTLALRSNLGISSTFRDLLHQVKDVTLGGYDHQQAPFEKVVDRVVKSRDMSMSPLFQVMFDLQNTPEEEEMVLPGVELSEYDYQDTTSQFDLTLTAIESGDSLQFSITYCTSLFKESSIVGMSSHYLTLLESIVSDYKLPIADLSMLPIVERDLILGNVATEEGFYFNPGATDLGEVVPINVSFEGIADAHTDSVAVIQGDVRWSYGALNSYANQVAHSLLDIGLEEEHCIGVYLDRSAEFIGCMLGIFKSGGVYTPLDTQNPASRIESMLSEGSFSVLITTSLLLSGLEELPVGISILVIDDAPEELSTFYKERLKDKEFIGSQVRENPENRNVLDSWAYVLYTSGSTGTPKGAITRHNGAMNHLLAEYSVMDLADGFRFLQSAGIGSDISVWQILGPLLKGGASVLVDKYDLLAYDRLLSIIKEEKVSLLEFVPTYMWGLLEHIKGLETPVSLDSLRTIMLVGEAIPVGLVNDLKELYPGIRLWNAYGPCEASDDVVQYEILEAISEASLRVPIGRVIPNMNAVVLDKQGNLCPIGVIGELCVSGVGVGAGYLGLPDRTSQSFVSNPFPELLGDTLYKTGDLSRWLPDGNLEFIGRADHQVKIRGHRVELEEIAAVIRKDVYIEDCHVLIYNDNDGNAYVLSFVILSSEGQAVAVDEDIPSRLHGLCSDELPAYMHPSQYCILDSFPQNLSDKVDSKKLIDLFLSDHNEGLDLFSKEYVGPRNSTDEALACIWQELLKVDKVGVYDDFFELGGHSLLATRLVSMVRRQLEVELGIRDIFIHTILSDLSDHILSSSSAVLLPRIEKGEREGRIPLSFSQQRLWFIDELEGSLQYHMPIVFRMDGDLDVEALSSSFKEIVRRHEVLRTVIKSEDGVAYQEVIDAEGWELEVVSDASEETMSGILEASMKFPFDLSMDYMMRMSLYELGDDRYVLGGAIHHISSDGWSEDVFVGELVSLYNSFREGKESPLAELPLQYIDYALWQRRYIEGDVLESQLSYWEEKLLDVPPLLLPTDYARGSVRSTKGSVHSFVLDKDVSASLDALCKEEGVTLFMLLLATFKVLLYRYSGQGDISVGTPIANRTQDETEGMIGFFVNTLALRSELGHSTTFDSLLQDVKDTTLSGYEHQHVPFERIVDRVVDSRDMSMSPLFQVMFVLQNTSKDTAISLDGVSLSGYEGYERGLSNFDLTLIAEEEQGVISLDLEYCSDLFSSATIAGMAVHYQELLRGIVANRNQQVGALSMLPATERLELLTTFNDTKKEYPTDNTLIALFKEQVTKNPGGIALEYEGNELSYKELDELSNRLAHYILSNYTVRLEDFIGVTLERSEWLIVSLLAVMKTGGVYIPIDPKYPAERISYIKEDSQCTLLIDIDFLEDFKKVADEYPVNLPSVGVSGRNLAYIIYTSGSTGQPKGVLIEHRGIVNTIVSQISEYEVSSLDHCLQFSNPSFDASIWEIFISLLSGSRMCIVSEAVKGDTTLFSRYIEEQGVSWATLPPAFLKLLEVSELSGIRTLITAGEEAPIDKALAFSDLGNRYVNAYGPTETSICASVFSGDITAKVPIGKPIANTSIYIVSDSDELQPVGVVGELCVAGSGLARGYLNREDLTTEKFVANPFVEGERMYRTGDLARWLPSGDIEFIGRKDDQVKIRGYRIELGEIEQVLSELSYIHSCCVVALSEGSGSKRLVGYVVVGEGYDRSVMQQDLSNLLPDYMVPGVWVELDVMPLTRNGKIDKKGLPSPDMSSVSSQEYVGPRNAIEEQLAAIWQELLGVERVGVYDNFFELGGDSIITIQIVTHINKLGYYLQARDVFENQTISELYQVIVNGAAKIEGEQGVLTGAVALLPIQNWYFDQVHDDDTHFNQSVFLSIAKTIERSSIEQVVKIVVSHHDALRFSYKKEENQWIQNYSEIEGVLEFVDINATDNNLEELIPEICNSYQKSLNIQNGEVFKVIYIKTPDSETMNRLLIVAHHLVVDGISWRILLDNFYTVLDALVNENSTDLGTKGSSYREWVSLVKEYANRGSVKAQHSYWKSIASDYKPLPVDRAYKGSKQIDVIEYENELNQEYTSLLIKEVHSSYGTDINDILLSCLVRTIHQWTLHDRVVIGLEGHGREDISRSIDISNTVGWFTNLYPVSLSVEEDISMGTLIKSIKEQLRSIPDKGLGFGALKYLNASEEIRSSLSGIQWDIIFNYLGQFDNAINEENPWFSEAKESSGQQVGDMTPFDRKLEINSSIINGVLSIGWNYSGKEYDTTTIEKLADQFLLNLEKLIIHCYEKEGREFTPSDYGLGDEVDHQELDTFFDEELDSEEIFKF